MCILHFFLDSEISMDDASECDVVVMKKHNVDLPANNFINRSVISVIFTTLKVVREC